MAEKIAVLLEQLSRDFAKFNESMERLEKCFRETPPPYRVALR